MNALHFVRMTLGTARRFSVLALLSLMFLCPQLIKAGQSGDFGYEVTTNSTVTITNYTGSGGSVSIPDTIEGLPVTSIGTKAFSKNTNLTEMVVASGITNIGGFAFSGCTGLMNISIPKGVTDIGIAAFQNCQALTSIALPDSVTSLRDAAFYGCTGITNLSLSVNLSNIPDNAFEFCISLKEITLPNGVTNIGMFTFGYCSNLAQLNLSTNLASLHEMAFGYATHLTNVALPASVNKVSGYAFGGCSALTNIGAAIENPRLCSQDGVVFNLDRSILLMFPGGKEGNYQVPDSVTNIDNDAFDFCARLQTVALGSNVTRMGMYPFLKCPALKIISVDTNNPNYSSKDGVLFDKTQSKLLCCPGAMAGTYVMPNTVSEIGLNSFGGCADLTNVVLSINTSEIDEGAFSGCTGLESLILPASLNFIKNNAFANCSHLKALYFKGARPGIQSTNVFENDTQLVLYRLSDAQNWPAFIFGHPIQIWEDLSVFEYIQLSDTAIIITNYNKFSFTAISLTVPPTINGMTVVGIGDRAFTYRGFLANIRLPNAITNIGTNAFYGCSSLTNINLPETLTSVGEGAFSGCTRLTQIILPEGLAAIASRTFYGCFNLTNVVLPSSLVSIGKQAFNQCSELSQINFPSHLAIIGDQAFEGCSMLFLLALPEGLVSIGRLAFYGCSRLKSVILPASLDSIGDQAFGGCPYLWYAGFLGNMPSSVGNNIFPNDDLFYTVFHVAHTTGWSETFQGRETGLCDKSSLLTYKFLDSTHIDTTFYLGVDGVVVIPPVIEGATVSQIGLGTFYSLPVTNITMPDTVLSIGDYAFCSTWYLTNVVMSHNAANIGEGAFYQSLNLASIELPASLTNMGNSAFYNCYSLTSIILPDALPLVPYNAFGFCFGLTNVTLGSNIKELGVSAFERCYGLTAMNIGNQVNMIDSSCFHECTNLAFVTLGDSVTNVAAHVFADCSSLGQVSLSANLNVMGSYVFENCQSLTNIHLPDNLLYIPRGAFSGCSNLDSVKFSQQITNIGSFAFQNCASLTNLVFPATLGRIGTNVFDGCNHLREIIFEGDAPTLATGSLFPTNITVIYYADKMGWGATFAGCKTQSIVKDVLYVYTPLDASHIEIVKYNGTEASLNVPSVIDGYSVNSLGTNAFANLPITNATLPDSLTTIGEGAFSGCTNLLTISLGTNVATLGNSAFNGCRLLNSIVLPDCLASLGTNVFAGCDALENILMSWNNPSFFCRDGVLCSRNPWTVLLCPPGKTGGYTIDTNFTAIADYAFAGCSRLSRLYFHGAPVPLLGENVFVGATNLTVYCYPGATGWENNYGGLPVVMWSASLFYTYENIAPSAVVITQYSGDGGYVAIPDKLDGLTVVGIAQNAFTGRSNIGSISLPASITNVAPGAFYGCSGLTNIGVDWFNPAYSAANGALTDKSAQVLLVAPCGRIGDFIVPASISSLGELAFGGCSGMTRVCFLGDAPALLGDHVFDGVSRATVCHLDDTAGWGSTYSGVPVSTWVDPPLFSYETNTYSVTLTKYIGYRNNVTVPETIDHLTVTSIGKRAFADCQSITNINLPATLGVIDSLAFYNCKGLKNLTLPERVAIIGEQAFNGCSGIESFVLPDNVGLVLFGAFALCDQLKTFHVGKGTTSMGNQSFLYCGNLTNITVDAGNATFSSQDGVLFSKEQSSLILFPPGLDGNYTVPAKVTNIADFAFASCDKLRSVTLPAGMTQIGCNAFYYCQSLTNISVADANPTFSQQAGVLLNKKQSILLQYPSGRSGNYIMPAGVTNIAAWAFSGSRNLANIHFNNTVADIGEYGLAGCTSLSTLTLPKSLVQIEDGAFSGCTNLNALYFEGDAPSLLGTKVFNMTNFVCKTIIYYREGTHGWSDTFGGQPTAKWVEQTSFEQWAAANGLSSQFPNACGEQDDPDHDGLTNLQEMNAGTDPIRAKSGLMFEMAARLDFLSDEDKTTIGTDQIALFFQSVPGKKYDIVSCDSLGGTWNVITNVTASATQKRIVLSKPAGNAFYRVVLHP